MGAILDAIKGALAPSPPAPVAPDRVAAVEAVHADLSAKAARISRVADEAKTALDASAAELARAERAAEDQGDEKSLDALHRATTRHSFAVKRHAAAQSEASTAQQEVATAQAAITSARAEVEAAARLAELQQKASLATYKQRTAPLARAAFDAIETLRSNLDAIDAAFADTNAASAELRALGYDVPDISLIHRIGEIVRLQVEKNPAGLMHFEHRGDRVHMLLHAVGSGPLARSLLASVDSALVPAGGGVPAYRHDENRACMGAMLDSRTWNDGIAATRDWHFRKGDSEEVSRRRVAREAPPPGCDWPPLAPPGAVTGPAPLRTWGYRSHLDLEPTPIAPAPTPVRIYNEAGEIVRTLADTGPTPPRKATPPSDATPAPAAGIGERIGDAVRALVADAPPPPPRERSKAAVASTPAPTHHDEGGGDDDDDAA